MGSTRRPQGRPHKRVEQAPLEDVKQIKLPIFLQVGDDDVVVVEGLSTALTTQDTVVIFQKFLYNVSYWFLVIMFTLIVNLCSWFKVIFEIVRRHRVS